jgi:hypothetical protein
MSIPTELRAEVERRAAEAIDLTAVTQAKWAAETGDTSSYREARDAYWRSSGAAEAWVQIRHLLDSHT